MNGGFWIKQEYDHFKSKRWNGGLITASPF
jgi:hypothetical protein